MRRILARYPLTALGLLGLTLMTLVTVGGIAYDDQGWRAVLFWGASLLVLPMNLVLEALFSLFGSEPGGWQVALAAAGHLLICVALDRLVLSRIGGRQR